jgi:four helix bundle protein
LGVQRFQDLRVWQRSHALALSIYRLTSKFPDCERFGVTSQLRRAAVSVAANIAEGTKRIGVQDYVRFINIVEGSMAETEYLLTLSRDLLYLSPDEAMPLIVETAEISRMLNALRAKVEQGLISKKVGRSRQPAIFSI